MTPEAMVEKLRAERERLEKQGVQCTGHCGACGAAFPNAQHEKWCPWSVPETYREDTQSVGGYPPDRFSVSVSENLKSEPRSGIFISILTIARREVLSTRSLRSFACAVYGRDGYDLTGRDGDGMWLSMSVGPLEFLGSESSQYKLFSDLIQGANL
jgi:hypothetical protein